MSKILKFSKKIQKLKHLRTGDQSGGTLVGVLPGSRQGFDTPVVAGQPVDAGLDKDKTELLVTVLAVALQVLAHGDSLLDQHVQVLRDGRGEAADLQDTEDLGAGDVLDLRDTEGITEGDTDLGRGETLLGELADVVGDLLRLHLQPRGSAAAVRDSTAAHTLSTSVHTTHLGCIFAQSNT